MANFEMDLVSAKLGLILEREVCDHVALGAREELGALAADGDELGRLGVEAEDFPEQVGIQAAAETLVRAQENDQLVLRFPLFSRADARWDRHDRGARPGTRFNNSA